MSDEQSSKIVSATFRYWLNLSLTIVRQRSCGKVMFSVVSVCSQGKRGGVPMLPLPIMHWNSLYIPPPLDIRHGTPPASDIWWPSLETCSDLFTSGPLPNQYWHLVATEAHTVCKRAGVHLTGMFCFANGFESGGLVEFSFITKTRMHPSSMRTIHCSGHLLGRGRGSVCPVCLWAMSA